MDFKAIRAGLNIVAISTGQSSFIYIYIYLTNAPNTGKIEWVW